MHFLRQSLIIAAALLFVACNDKTPREDVEEPTYAIGHISTRLGDMYFWLYDETPNHKAAFVRLCNEKHYNQFTFNRVVNNFVIQGGCPDSPQYFENSPYLIDPEFHDSIGHTYGALGMGRDDNPKKQSNACQLYIVSKEAGLAFLDSNYMIFGMLIKGEEILEAIEHVQVDDNDQPLDAIPMQVNVLYYSEQELLDSLGFQL